MFTPEQYREKAARYTELARHGNTPDEVRGFQTHERSLTMLADNEQWLTDNDGKLANNLDEMAMRDGAPSRVLGQLLARFRGTELRQGGGLVLR